MRDTTAPVPAPKIYATRLKSNIPTSNHTSEPIITKENAMIVVIFISFPRIKSMSVIFYIMQLFRVISRLEIFTEESKNKRKY